MVICLEGGANDLHMDDLADATTTPLPLASLKSRMVLPFLCWLTLVVLEKRPLNGCFFVYACKYSYIGHIYRVD